MTPRLVPPPLPSSPRDPRDAARDGASRPRAIQRPRILLVGDAGARLAELEASLAGEDAEVIGATGVRTALMLLGSGGVALAIVDMEKPDDRYRTAELLRGAAQTLPLIFVTAGPHDPRAPFRGSESGAVFFLYKPVEPPLLMRTVSALLQVHRHERLLSQRGDPARDLRPVADAAGERRDARRPPDSHRLADAHRPADTHPAAPAAHGAPDAHRAREAHRAPRPASMRPAPTRPVPAADRWMEDFLSLLSDDLRAPAETTAERRARAVGGARRAADG